MKKFILSLLIIMTCVSLHAQVTTSGIYGTVSYENDEPVIGAVVIVTHTPSGTQYSVATDRHGVYRIVNMRPGGPYTAEIRMLGCKTLMQRDIEIPLGDNFMLNAVLTEDDTPIEEVVVIAKGSGSIMNADRNGASTHINSRQLNTLPTLTRSINDFTRLTPQAGNNGTFGGRDTRYNNVTIDGAAFSQRFGLSTTNNLPGGDAQPISLDAIQEISVSLTPFDIRQSNFTGANINAVTRSGDNRYTATAYAFLRPKTFNGKKIEDMLIPDTRRSFRQSYGLSLGGPIVRNKLFFFLNGEMEGKTYPGNDWIPSQDGVGSNEQKIAAVTEADMKRVYDHLLTRYGYDAGNYTTPDEFSSDNYKIFARLDWNINRNHRVMLRYNMVNSTNDELPNRTSCPAGAYINGTGRNSIQARSFSNSYFGYENKVQSITGEWNADFGSRVQNKLLASYTSISDMRTSRGSLFPFVDILDGAGNYYMNFGTELFAFNNGVDNRTFNVTDNVTVALGRHTLTAGVSYEHQYFSNRYMREGTTYYQYKTVDDFLSDAKPYAFAYTLGYPGDETPKSELTFGLASAYVQDEWQIDRRFRLTAGIRFELPIYYTELQGPTRMQIDGTMTDLSNVEFVNGQRLDLAVWPKAKPLFSPRVGFNWDVLGNKQLQVRGGTGIFTGMLPFVWFTNQPQNSGFVQTPEIVLKGDAVPDGLQFNPNFRDQVFNNPSITVPERGVAPYGSALAKVSDDFKLPQLWRTSLAVDMRLPWQTILTVEGLYSKDINAVMQRNVNLPEADKRYEGPDNRPYYSSNRLYPEISSAMVLCNTNKGHQYSVTAQLTKNFWKGFSGMIAYTYSIAKDVTANPGSVANSAWTANTTATNLNDPELSYSAFSMPHRVTGYISYSVVWLKHARTTVSLYYNGIHSGRLSYTYVNDANGDGAKRDLIYIPKNMSDMNFVDITSTTGDGASVVTYSAEEQARDFEAFIQNTPYLKKHRGKYAGRYADKQPWSNRFDLKIVQDIFSRFGSDRDHTLQLSLDITNVGNLLNKNWGAISYTNGLQSYESMQLLNSKGADRQGRLSYTLNAKNSEDFKAKTVWTPLNNVINTWGIQLGVRLIF